MKKIQPQPWQEYTGEYEKTAYDLLLKDGTLLIAYYPNAGSFTALQFGPHTIPGHKVDKIRLSVSLARHVRLLLPKDYD